MLLFKGYPLVTACDMEGNMAMSGKICLVTGASRGIGKGIAVMLSKAGATVYVTGIFYQLKLILNHVIIHIY